MKDWSQLSNWFQTRRFLCEFPVGPKLCPAVTLSHQDGCHSAVALLLKATLIQVSDYRLLGASGSVRFVILPIFDMKMGLKGPKFTINYQPFTGYIHQKTGIFAFSIYQ
jgi:hypothetical protein